MESNDLNNNTYRKNFVLTFLILIFIAFLFLIRDLIITVILAATFSGLLYPLQKQVKKLTKGREALSAIIVIVISVIIIGVPLLVVLTISANEAVQISASIKPWIQEQINKPPEQWMQIIEKIPFLEKLEPYRSKIIEGFSQLLKITGSHLMGFVSAATTGALGFIFRFFVGIYCMFFFLKSGEGMVKKVMSYIPLRKEETREIAQKGLGIIRATIKSLFVIGIIQGGLVGLALWVLGIEGAFFWAIIVAILSAIPGLGAPVVWVPAVIYLFFNQRITAGVGLALWGIIVVGAVDNFLRPIIIGKDTNVSELLVFLSILGGIVTFGVVGIIIGPVIISILISTLEIYSRIFQHILEK